MGVGEGGREGGWFSLWVLLQGTEQLDGFGRVSLDAEEERREEVRVTRRTMIVDIVGICICLVVCCRRRISGSLLAVEVAVMCHSSLLLLLECRLPVL